MKHLGFADLDDDALLPTAEVARRLGFATMRGFYDWVSGARRREGFPRPRRRGFYHVAALKRWLRRDAAPGDPPATADNIIKFDAETDAVRARIAAAFTAA